MSKRIPTEALGD
jgi:hypothetical protein